MATQKKQAPVVGKPAPEPKKEARLRRPIADISKGHRQMPAHQAPAQRPMPRPSLSSGEKVTLKELCSDMDKWLKETQQNTPEMRGHMRASVLTSCGNGQVDTFPLEAEELEARIAELLKD